jgi:hypothetical protein
MLKDSPHGDETACFSEDSLNPCELSQNKRMRRQVMSMRVFDETGRRALTRC